MAEFIPRDISTPFDPADEEQIAEFEGFASDVPTTDGMIDAVSLVPGFTRANAVRAAKLFSAGYLNNLVGLVGGVNDLPTPDLTAPSAEAIFERRGLHDQQINVPLAGGGTAAVEMWSFERRIDRGIAIGGADRDAWPAHTIRVREGEIVHTIMGSRSGPHTIHHHGIEPTAANDGVGHLTFEVGGGQYAYQWQAAEAGTYFYHCHRNTTLHFEMGMYGMLIVDPDVDGAPFTDGGPGWTLMRDTPTSYDAEAIWVADDIDTRWHGADVGDPLFNGTPVIGNSDVAAGIQAPDTDARTGFISINDIDNNPRLHDFNPNVFVVSGVAAPFEDDGQNLITAVGATIQTNQRLLVRALNASYCTQVWKFPTSLQGTVTAVDGRTLGRSKFGSYSQPFSLASIGHQFMFTTAQRWDILIDGSSATFIGQHIVEIEFRHWITNALLRTLRVPINITSVQPG